MYRQGKILIIPINRLPPNLKEIGTIGPVDGRIVLHASVDDWYVHAIFTRTAKRYRLRGAPPGHYDIYIHLSEPGELRHEAHRPIRLPAGFYRVARQRDYRPGQRPERTPIPALPYLSQEQAAEFEALCNQALSIEFSTAPIDHTHAEAAVNALYRGLGRSLPRIVRCGSPLALSVVRAQALRFRDRADEYLGSSRRRSVLDEIQHALGSQLCDGIRQSLDDAMQSRTGLGEEFDPGTMVDRAYRPGMIGNAVLTDTVEELRSLAQPIVNATPPFVSKTVVSAIAEVKGRSNLIPRLQPLAVGERDHVFRQSQHALVNMSVEEFLRTLGMADEGNPKLLLGTLIKAVGWFCACANVCLVAERPTSLSRDSLGRLHSTEGPSVVFPDGWAIHCYEGVLVPAYVATSPEKIQIAEIERQSNTIVRQVMIQRYGVSRYLTDLGAQLVSQNELGSLWRMRQPNDEPLMLLRSTKPTPEPNGERREQLMRVPPEMENPSDAIAWSFGIGSSEYLPIVET